MENLSIGTYELWLALFLASLLSCFFGFFYGGKATRDKLDLRAWEAGDKREWVLVGVQMHGLNPKHNPQPPVAVARLNVRTKEVRGAPRGYCDIVDYPYQLGRGILSDNVMLGAPPYYPGNSNMPVEVIMCGTVYTYNIIRNA